MCDYINLVERDYFGLTYRDQEDIRVSFSPRTFHIADTLRFEDGSESESCCCYVNIAD